MTTTRVRRTGAIALIAATATALTGCAGVLGARMTYDDTEKGKISEIVLSGGRGDVTITSSSASTETSIRRIIRRADNPEESYRLDGTKLILDTDCGPQCSASYEIKTPPGVAVTGTLRSGDLNLDGIGATDLQVTSGDVVITAPTGPVEMRATSGEIQVLNAQKAVKVQATSGDIRVLNAAGPVETTVTSGEINVSLTAPNSVTAHTTSGDVFVAVPPGDYRISSQARSGDVNLNGLISDPDAKNVIEVRVTSGDATVAPA